MRRTKRISQPLDLIMGYSFRLLGVIHAALIYLLAGMSFAWSQGSTFVVEEYMVHDGEQGVAELAGQTTYRFYLELNDPDDFVSAVYGGDTAPMTLSLDAPMFNSPFATGSTAGGILPIVVDYFPEVAYDSWVTIGLESSPSGGGEADVSALQSEEQPFLQNFVAGSPTDGDGFVVDDELGGAWFLLSGTPNGYAGEDLKVLVMQVTTSGVPSGTLNAQIIPADPALDAEQVQQGFNGTDVWDLMPSAAYPGCTDPAACNFDESATEDDGSCEYGTCAGCTDVWACNFDPNATEEDGSCDYLACAGCTDAAACNYDPEAIYNDGSCEYASCENLGCTFSNACNYDPEATVNDGSCEYSSCAGCTDMDADNYDPTATLDDGSCAFNGCLNPLACNYDPTANTSDGSCEYTSCIGCMDSTACNFDSTYTISDPADCQFAEEGYDCAGGCLFDADGDLVCDEFEVLGCTDGEAENFNSLATEDDGSCVYALSGCTNPLACNFNPDATSSDGSCDFTSCIGCMEVEACNYDAAYTTADNASCLFAEEFYDCSGDCIGDNDGDGICNELEVIGCTDAMALNFDANATDNDGSCEYPASCHDSAACNYEAYEGYCIEVEPFVVHDGFVGESDLTGFVTYRIYALCENQDDFVSAVAGDDVNPSFVHTTTSFFQHEAGGVLGQSVNPLVFPFIPDAAYDSWVTIGLESAAEGDAGESGISILEGLDPWVEPFELGGSLEMSDDLGGVWYILNGASNGVAGEDLKVLLGQFTTDGNLDGQLYVQFFENGDGMDGGFNKMIGLQDACGLPSFAGCEYPEVAYDCDGVCVADDDGDGVCNELEIEGCTDPEATNYVADATDEDGSCDYFVDPCLDDIIPPVFTFVPADSTVQCDQAMPTTMATAEDECDETVQVMFVDGPIEFVYDCPPYNYLCTRTFFATDDAGNQAQAIQMISVADTLAPEILNLPAAEIWINEQEGEEIPTPFIAVQDACDGNAQWSSADETVVQSGDTVTYHRTYTTFDACGNEADWTQTIHVIIAIEGCTDAAACNFNPAATNEDGSCTYAGEFVDCDGLCLNDSDGDGVCDELEIGGCTAPTACNYDEAFTDDDGTCDFCSCEEDEILSFGLEIDTIAVHDTGSMAGMITYRMFVTTILETDFVSAVYGNDEDTLLLAAESGWHQDEMGSHLAQGINLDLIGSFPQLAYDSWVTIGVDGPAADTENSVNAVGSSGPEGWVSQFESGNDLVMDDEVGGSWFILNGGSNGVAGDDLRVLIAQVTTLGGMHGQLNVQVFNGGDNTASSLHQFQFDGTTWTNPPVFPNACGCLDSEALNYDSEAEYDNDSCAYPVLGCTDTAACNYDEIATDDDGSCTYPEPALDCAGDCLLDADSDGICDEFEVPGCTDTSAINFDGLATDDDGSCVYCTITAAASVSDVSCAGEADGSLEISVQGAYPDSSEITYQLLPQDLIQTDSVFAGLSGGAYVIIVADESGCEAVLELVVEEPDPLLALLDNVTGSVPDAEEGSISVSITGGVGPYVFSWIQLDGAFISDEEDITNLNPGTYQLVVTDSNGCSTTSFEIVVESIVSVAELLDSDIRVFPNPAHDFVQVTLPMNQEFSQLDWYDMQGKLMASRVIVPHENVFKLDVSDWSNGLYVMRIKATNRIIQKKIKVVR